MAEPSLGEGIGLQQGANRDDFWAKQIYTRGVERKREREAADEDLIKSSDFKLDYSNKLPVYAKQMAEVQREVMNKVAFARQNNKNTARAVVADDIYKAQLALGKLEQDNARAMAYIADDKTRKDPTVISTLTSPDATFEDIASIHDGQFFMTDNSGTFAYKPVPLDYAAPKFDKYSEVGLPTGNYKIQGDGRYDELQNQHTKESIDNEINQLAQDRKFQENVWFETRQVQPPEGVDPIKFKQDLVMAKASEIVNKSVPKGSIEWKRNELPRPLASDKKDEPIDLRPLAQYDIASKVIDTYNGGKPTNVKVPIQINLPEKINPAVIPTGLDVLDVETNKQVSENPTNLSFTPSTLQYKNITRTKNGVKTKSREWYVLGTAIDIAKANEVGGLPPIQSEGESDADYNNRKMTWGLSVAKASEGQKPGSKKTTFNVMVPLASVRGALKGVTQAQLDELANEYDSRGGGAQSGSKIIKSNVDDRGLISVVFNENGKEKALDYITVEEFKKQFPNETVPSKSTGASKNNTVGKKPEL